MKQQHNFYQHRDWPDPFVLNGGNCRQTTMSDLERNWRIYEMRTFVLVLVVVQWFVWNKGKLETECWSVWTKEGRWWEGWALHSTEREGQYVDFYSNCGAILVTPTPPFTVLRFPPLICPSPLPLCVDCFLIKYVDSAYREIPCSLVGQDLRLSPVGPGFKSGKK